MTIQNRRAIDFPDMPYPDCLRELKDCERAMERSFSDFNVPEHSRAKFRLEHDAMALDVLSGNHRRDQIVVEIWMALKVLAAIAGAVLIMYLSLAGMTGP